MDESARRFEYWQTALSQVEKEFAGLPGAERDWIDRRLAGLARIQQEIHAHFLAADGPQVCTECQGACCARGSYHLTLANLLYLLTTGHSFKAHVMPMIDGFDEVELSAEEEAYLEQDVPGHIR